MKALLAALLPAAALAAGPVVFEKLVLTDKYHGDGLDYADFNKDGKLDIACGPFYYAGPDFKTRIAIAPEVINWDASGMPMSEISNMAMIWAHDFNNDGWPDIMRSGQPQRGIPSWFENNLGKPGHWAQHKISDHLYGESPDVQDIDGDGQVEAMTNQGGKVGWLSPDWANPLKEWTFKPISAAGPWYEYTHGQGIGDINGDGRLDIIHADTWWAQPPKGTEAATWPAYPTGFREGTGKGEGGAQIFAYDVDGDGDNDAVSSLHGHGWGLAWFEHVKAAGQIQWVKHKLMGDNTETAKYGLAYSQPHALELRDVDGDGLKDIISGKRKWAHGPNGDKDPGGPAVVYWWRLVRTPGKASTFVPYLIDDKSGLGVQIRVADIDNDGTVDIMTASKLGAFVFFNRTKPLRVWIAPRADAAPRGQQVFRVWTLKGRDLRGRLLKFVGG